MSKILPIFVLAWILFAPTARAAGSPRHDQSPAFKNEVTITVENGVRIIKSNGVPNHEMGQFPNAGNPNTLAPQQYAFRMPAAPKPAEKPTPLRMQPFGVAVNGVVFDPGAAEWWNRDRNSGWQYEPLTNGEGYLGVDHSHAHVQPNGAYHYHGAPTALIYALTDGKEKMVIVGWAADGFPIYNNLGHITSNDATSPLKPLKSSYRVKSGTRPSGPGGAYDGTYIADHEYVAGAGDLDECNGRFEITPEYPNGIYHYVLTDTFPFVPRMYRGTPDPSFNTHGGPGGPGGPGGAGGPGGGGGQRPPLPLIIKALDTNGDGILSVEEIAKAPDVLKTLDRNGDGQLSFEEYMGFAPNRGPRPSSSANGPAAGAGGQGGRPRRPLPAIVRALDANGDGIIDADEMKNAVAALQKLDTKGSGQLTAEQYLGPRPEAGPPGSRPEPQR